MIPNYKTSGAAVSHTSIMRILACNAARSLSGAHYLLLEYLSFVVSYSTTQGLLYSNTTYHSDPRYDEYFYINIEYKRILHFETRVIPV